MDNAQRCCFERWEIYRDKNKRSFEEGPSEKMSKSKKML